MKKTFKSFILEGAYMYPITVDRNPKEISYEKEFDLEDIELSLDDIRKYVKEDETFMIDNDEMKIKVYCKRLETETELENRISKEENYMKKYKEFQKTKKIK